MSKENKDCPRKQFLAKSIDVDDGERTLTAVITTGTVDRDNEVLLSKGADFENFLKNPVVLWAHNYGEPPIGRALWIKKGRNRLTAKMKFAETDKAEEIYQLYKGGFLNAFSVGFQPKLWHEPTPEEIKSKPDWAEARRIYDEWEMYEYSSVPVGANPEALSVAVKTKKLNLSEQTREELGIEEGEIYVAEPPFVKVAEPEQTNEAVVPIKTDQYISTEQCILTDPYVRTGPDMGGAVDEAIKKLKGRMF